MSEGIGSITCDFTQIQQLLRELPDKFVIKDVKRVQADKWQMVADEAKRLVPVDTGRLQEMIAVKAGFSKRTGVVFATCGLRKIGAKERLKVRAKKYQRSIGYTNVKTDGIEYDAYYGVFVEFGAPAHNQHPHPFMRPAFDSKRGAVLDEYQSELQTVLEQEFAKLKEAPKKRIGK